MFGNRISVLIKLQSLRITSFHVQVWGKNKSPQARLERLNKPVNICALILFNMPCYPDNRRVSTGRSPNRP